jgi:hypothetical protein
MSTQAAIDGGRLRLPAADGAAKGPPHMGRVLACAQEMASALHYLHGQKINHGARAPLSTAVSGCGMASSTGLPG